MICLSCGFADEVNFNRCPMCNFVFKKHGRLKGKIFLLLLKFFDWLLDRRLAIITKRQQFDTKPTRFNYYRVWWVYYLFDILPILRFQDPISLFIKGTLVTPNETSKNNTSTGSDKKWN